MYKQNQVVFHDFTLCMNEAAGGRILHVNKDLKYAYFDILNRLLALAYAFCWTK